MSLGLFQLASHLNLGDHFSSRMKVKFLKVLKYQRLGIVWSREDLNETVTKYIRENTDVKGKPNLTIRTFCNWVNEDLLPNETLKPGFPERFQWKPKGSGCMSLGLMFIEGGNIC